MVRFLDVFLNVFGVKQHVFELTLAVQGGLIGEVFGAGLAALATRYHRAGFYALAKLNHGHEAVAHAAVPLFGAGIGLGRKSRQRTPGRGRESHRQAGLLVVVRFLNLAGQALVAVDVAPGRFPGAKVAGEVGQDFGQGGYFFLGRGAADGEGRKSQGYRIAGRQPHGFGPAFVFSRPNK